MQLKASQDKKVSETLSQPTNKLYCCISIVPIMQEAEVGGSQSKANLGESIIPYLKNA
jgi:hypothetical protein